MIVVESKRKKLENILKKYPASLIVDVTSNAKDDYVRLSPFYPHGGIPVPFSDGCEAASVEGIWQGLKVFENEDVDCSCFRNILMKGIKRSVRTHGRVIGHRKGVWGEEILDYVEAKHLIYIPSYRWVLENKVNDLVERLRTEANTRPVVLLDYNTCCDVDSSSKPLSHAGLIKAFVETTYPYGAKNQGNKVNIQLSLFD